MGKIKYMDLSNDELAKIIKVADKMHCFSDIEKQVIIDLLGYCHANDVKWTENKMFEVFFRCDAMPGNNITTLDCADRCERNGCSNCTVVGDAECLLNGDKHFKDVYLENEFWFEDEIRSILKKYKGHRNEPLDGDETEYIAKRVFAEINLIEGNITEQEYTDIINGCSSAKKINHKFSKNTGEFLNSEEEEK